MSTFSSVMIAVIIFMFFLCGCVRLGESEMASRSLRQLFRNFAKRPLAEKLFILVFVVLMVAHGGSKSTNSVPQGGGGNMVVVVSPGTGADGSATGGTITIVTVTNAVITGGAVTNGSVAAAGAATNGVATGGAVTNGAVADGGVAGALTGDGIGGTALLTGPESPRLTTNQYAAGFALVRANTNAASPWLALPSNVTVHAPWTRYGVAEDTFWLPATNWAFVLGTNAVDGVHVSSSGTLSFEMPKGSPHAAEIPDGTDINFLAPLQAPLGIVPPQGCFWHAVSPSNSLLLTWQDAFAGRDTNSPVTVQAELFWNGDFAYRYAFTNSPALSNFVVGAQNRGGGETWAINATNLLADGLELRWRAFGLLDPGVDDHDGDGISTYDEVMLYGTSPSLKDSDRDRLEDAAELVAGMNALNPDIDGDGLADGIDPQPTVWNNADADVDGDGFKLWMELYYGTSDEVSGDVDAMFASGSRAVEFTVSGNVLPAAVLAIDEFPVLLADRTSFCLKFAPDSVHTLHLHNAPGVSVAVRSQDCASLTGATGGFAAGCQGSGTASLAFPVVNLGVGGVLCLHSGETSLCAQVTGGLPGRFVWSANGVPLQGEGTSIGHEGVPSGPLSVTYYPDGGVAAGIQPAGQAALPLSGILSSTGDGTPCSCDVTLTRCKRGGFCEHGVPWDGCGSCVSDDFWCHLHMEPKPICPCLTLSGGGVLPPDGTDMMIVGSLDDTNEPGKEQCCGCPEHLTILLPTAKVNIVREVASALTLRRDSDTGETVSEGGRLEGPSMLAAQGTALSARFGDACAAFSQEDHPEEAAWEWVAYTVADVSLDPDRVSEDGSCLIRGGMGCMSRVAVVTQSALVEGCAVLSAGSGLLFSEQSGTAFSAAAEVLTNTPPGSVHGSRDFYLAATNGGHSTLSYRILDPDGAVYCATNIAVEAVMAKFATNAYYVACGSALPFTVRLSDASHDPQGFTLAVDGEDVAQGQPPWQVDTSSLTGGVHTLTVRSGSFEDMEDSAALKVVKVDISASTTNVCWTTPQMTLSLTADSYPDGDTDWTVDPSGLPFSSSGGRSITLFPSNGVAGTFTVTAKSKRLAECEDSCVVNVVKVEKTEVSCDKFGTSGTFGANPESFDGNVADFGTPDRPPPYWWQPGTYAEPASKALKVFFKYVKNPVGLPGAFDLALKADIRPDSVPDSALGIEWTRLEGSPESGSFVETDKREVLFRNPAAGGLYKFRVTARVNPGQSITGDAWVLLPKAGGEVADWMAGEVPALVARVQSWRAAVDAVAVSNGLDIEEFRSTAWKAIATADFDYQGVAGSPTARYSFTDDDRPAGHVPDASIPGMAGAKGNGDWDEPSFATLRGVVVSRAKINNAMYAVWGRALGYQKIDLKAGAYWNAASRSLWDDASSQNAVDLGCDLYAAFAAGGSLSGAITRSAAEGMQSPDSGTGLNDVNLWPDATPASGGFWLPDMPTDYDSLKDGENTVPRGRLF